MRGNDDFNEVISMRLDSSALGKDIRMMRDSLRKAAIDSAKDLNFQIDAAVKFQRKAYESAAKVVKEMYGDQIKRVKDIKILNAEVAVAAIKNEKELDRERQNAVDRSLKAIAQKRNAEARAHGERRKELIEEIEQELKVNRAAAQRAGGNQSRGVTGFVASPGSGGGNGSSFGSGFAGAFNFGGAAGLGAMTATKGIDLLISTATAGVKASEELNSALHDMATLMDGMETHTVKFAGNFDMLTVAAEKLSVKLNKRMPEVVDSFKMLLSAGTKEEDIPKFAEIAGNLANATGADVKGTVNTLTTIRDAWHLTVNDMTGVSNELFRAIDVGKIEINDLNANIGRLIPVASGAGLSITDMLGAVSSLSRIMTPAQAITSITKLIEDITNPSDKAAKAFKALGIETGQAQFKLKGFDGVINDIIKSTGGKLDKLGDIFPDARAVRGGQGYANVSNLLNEHIKAIGEAYNSQLALNAAEERMNTLGVHANQTWLEFWNKGVKGGADFDSKLNDLVYGTDTLIGRLRILVGLNEFGLGNPKPKSKVAVDAGLGSDPTAKPDSSLLEASVKTINDEMTKGALLASTYGQKVDAALNGSNFRKIALENFDGLVRDLIKKMDERKDAIVEHYKQLVEAGTLTPMQGAVKAQKRVDEDNSASGDLDSLKQLLTQRDAIASGSEGPSGKFLGDLISDTKHFFHLLGEKIKESHKEFVKSEAEKVKIANDTISEFEKLYNKDKQLIEKAQKEKLRIVEEYEKKMRQLDLDRLSEFEKNQKLLNTITQHGDPANAQRNAKKERIAATGELNSYISTGGDDKDKIGKLADRIRAAIDNEFGGANNKRSDMWSKLVEQLSQLENKGFDSADSKLKKDKAKELAGAAYAPLTPQEMAAQAINKVGNKKELKEEVVREVKAVLKIEVDGSLSKESKDALAKELYQTFKTWETNGTSQNNRPKNSFSDRGGDTATDDQ